MRFEVAIVLAVVGLAFAGAILLYAYAAQQDRRKRLLQRLPPPVIDTGPVTPEQAGFFHRLMDSLWEQAGYEPTPRQGWIVAVGFGASALLGMLLFGLPGIPIGPIAFAVLALSWLYVKGARRRRRVLEQLPLFLDSVIRAIRAGNSVEQSLILAAADSDDPIRGVFERVSRQVQLGVPLDLALADVARLYRLQELEMLQTAVSVNLRYGGPIRDILENVIKALRQREAARRDLRALTGETRLSAWILAILPITLALYIVAMNPSYFMQMWENEAGRRALYFGAGMQLAGVFIIWRMLRSI